MVTIWDSWAWRSESRLKYLGPLLGHVGGALRCRGGILVVNLLALLEVLLHPLDHLVVGQCLVVDWGFPGVGARAGTRAPPSARDRCGLLPIQPQEGHLLPGVLLLDRRELGGRRLGPGDLPCGGGISNGLGLGEVAPHDGPGLRTSRRHLERDRLPEVGEVYPEGLDLLPQPEDDPVDPGEGRTEGAHCARTRLGQIVVQGGQDRHQFGPDPDLQALHGVVEVVHGGAVGLRRGHRILSHEEIQFLRLLTGGLHYLLGEPQVSLDVHPPASVDAGGFDVPVRPALHIHEGGIHIRHDAGRGPKMSILVASGDSQFAECFFVCVECLRQLGHGPEVFLGGSIDVSDGNIQNAGLLRGNPEGSRQFLRLDRPFLGLGYRPLEEGTPPEDGRQGQEGRLQVADDVPEALGDRLGILRESLDPGRSALQGIGEALHVARDLYLQGFVRHVQSSGGSGGSGGSPPFAKAGRRLHQA